MRAFSAVSRLSVGSEPDNDANKHIKKLARWVADQVYTERMGKESNKDISNLQKELEISNKNAKELEKQVQSL